MIKKLLTKSSGQRQRSEPESDHICIFHRRPLYNFLHFLLFLMRSVTDNFIAYLPSIDRGSVKHSWTSNTSGSHKLLSNLTPSISAWTAHGLSLITSSSKMTTVLIRRNAPNDSCHNFTALMSRCTKTSFIITPHYKCAHRNSDNLHNADFVGNSAVGEWRMGTFWWSYAYS